MFMDTSIIYEKLEFYREQYLAQSIGLCVDKIVSINNKQFTLNIWLDHDSSFELVVFMLTESKLLFKSHYCLGLRKLHKKQIEYLTNEQLWEIGIP